MRLLSGLSPLAVHLYSYRVEKPLSASKLVPPRRMSALPRSPEFGCSVFPVFLARKNAALPMAAREKPRGENGARFRLGSLLLRLYIDETLCLIFLCPKILAQNKDARSAVKMIQRFVRYLLG